MTSPTVRHVFRRPLVAFDGSSHAEAALAQATEMVRTSNGRLSIITVVPERSFWALSAVPVLVVHLSAGSGGVGRWTMMPKTTDGAFAYAQGSSHA